MHGHMVVFAAKLVETGTYAGDEDDDVLFDEMVDDYEDEDEAIDAVSTSLNKEYQSALK